eukprot:55583_1
MGLSSHFKNLNQANSNSHFGMISPSSLIKLMEETYEDEIDDPTALLLIKAMGGIKTVMSKTLEMHDQYHMVNEKQLYEIHQVLSTPQPYRQKQKYKQTTKIKDNKIEEMEKNNEIILHLDVMNNILADISDNVYNSVWKVLNFHSTPFFIVLSLIVIAVLIFTILSSLNDVFALIFWICMSCLYITFCIPFFIVLLLSVNKITFIKSINTAEFWLMLGSLIRWRLCYTWNEFIHPTAMMNKYLSIYVLLRISGVISWLLIIMSIMLLDGIKVSVSLKRFINISMILLFTFWVISGWIKSYTNADDSLVHLYGDIAISLRDQSQSAVEIIWILFMKQAVTIFFRKDTAIQLKYIPIIKWNNIQNENKAKLKEIIEQNNELNINNKTEFEMQSVNELEINSVNTIHTNHDNEESVSFSINADL